MWHNRPMPRSPQKEVLLVEDPVAAKAISAVRHPANHCMAGEIEGGSPELASLPGIADVREWVRRGGPSSDREVSGQTGG